MLERRSKMCSCRENRVCRDWLLGVKGLVVKYLLEEDEGAHARPHVEEARHHHAGGLTPGLGHDRGIAGHR